MAHQIAHSEIEQPQSACPAASDGTPVNPQQFARYHVDHHNPATCEMCSGKGVNSTWNFYCMTQHRYYNR